MAKPKPRLFKTFYILILLYWSIIFLQHETKTMCRSILYVVCRDFRSVQIHTFAFQWPTQTDSHNIQFWNKNGFYFSTFYDARDLLGLSLLPGVTPHVNAMASHQNGRCARIFLHCFVHALLQITFERRIFNDRNDQFFIVSQISTQLMIVNALRRNSLIIFLINFLLFFFFFIASERARPDKLWLLLP